MAGPTSLDLADRLATATADEGLALSFLSPEDVTPRLIEALSIRNESGGNDSIRLFASFGVQAENDGRITVLVSPGLHPLALIREDLAGFRLVRPTRDGEGRQVFDVHIVGGTTERIHLLAHEDGFELGGLMTLLGEPAGKPVEAPGPPAPPEATRHPAPPQAPAVSIDEEFPEGPAFEPQADFGGNALEPDGAFDDAGAQSPFPNGEGPAGSFEEGFGPAPEVEHRAAELAQIGASMPLVAQIGQPVPVVVRLSRGRVHVTAGSSHDETVIVVDPNQAVTVTLVRQGLDLDADETGERLMQIPEVDAPEKSETFRLIAVQLGDVEVQVIARQDHPQPIAVLRLQSVVQELPIREEDQPMLAEVEGGVARSIDRFLAPKTLTVDEDLVDTQSRLTFELVLPGFHHRYDSVALDKAELMATLYTDIEAAWEKFANLDPTERSASFRGLLREQGNRLARHVLPGDLYAYLRAHPDEFDELTILTSAETDIPWELLYIWDETSGEDEFDEGFLGRAGLVRWIYSTAHPKTMRIRPGAAHYLIPEYVDPRIALSEAEFEFEYLDAFQATPITPGSAADISALLHSENVDLLHFAGHGVTDDSVTPPLQQMVLANFRLPSDDADANAEEPPDPRTVAYSLDDLRLDLPDKPPFTLSEPGPLIVLNACRLGRAPTRRSEQGGFAEAFLRGGAAAFVGCLWSIGDQPARAFVEAFYDGLHEGLSVSKATIRARLAARMSGDSSWLAYTVYAHPDAHVELDGIEPKSSTRESAATAAGTLSKGTAMTSPAPSASRGSSNLTAAQLRALHPHVVNIPDGKLATGPTVLPSSDTDFKTVPADLDALFDTHLPQFIAAQNGQRPVPLVIWAHGGLVDKGAGLTVAQAQVAWWKANGAYPVHFVWETGLASSLWDAVKDALPGRPRSMDDFFDGVIEQAVRLANGKATWGAMKTIAENASKPGTGGAWQFAQRLGAFMKANPGEITVHAVGHSAGSIFHSHLLPVALEAGVPSISTLNLLAPAVRVDTFKKKLVPVLDQVDSLALFTMTKAFELDDTCLGIYKKSLLYLIRAALENETGAAILGLQEVVKADPELSALFGAPGSGAKGEVMWSRTVGGGSRTSSQATTHGAFDGETDTMNSVARRVVGSDLTRPWQRARAIDDALWPTEDEVFEYVESRTGAPSTVPDAEGRRRALCIGIDTYPTAPLNGCVEDAKAWAKEFTTAGFRVETLHDKDATRANMVDAIQNLVVSSRPGDVLALQFSGHGTTIVDLDGDEAIEDREGELVDEALCPWDFHDGELLIDDDLGAIWDLLPDGVSLTIFFDSCHSGGAQRKVLGEKVAADTRSRYVSLGRTTVAAYKEKRGGIPVTTARDNERSVFFGACLENQPAYESPHETPDGTVSSGDFTARAIPLLHAAIGTSTNAEFYDAVLAAFGDGRRQTPVLKPPALQARKLLTGVPDQPTVVPHTPTSDTGRPVPVPDGVVAAGGTVARNQALAEFLRATATLIES
ncbi:caspase family protein [Agromyces sp. Soil535]|uniref:caspase family protein n=1 Tax=Agromyces sp. Soil535 TaxID=1736390 RepID=UPI0006FCCDEF|nr:caspase family protein [Agromyces sp. Soil535]KRE31085.1 hypothetical protein ASG80_00935 [Agromyces sp. Soil535]